MPFFTMGDRPDVIDQDHQLVALAHGFDSLLRIAQRLTAQERELSSRLQFAHDEVGLSHFSFLFLFS